jgi:hypothetical protein
MNHTRFTSSTQRVVIIPRRATTKPDDALQIRRDPMTFLHNGSPGRLTTGGSLDYSLSAS